MNPSERYVWIHVDVTAIYIIYTDIKLLKLACKSDVCEDITFILVWKKNDDDLKFGVLKKNTLITFSLLINAGPGT